jgi:hypothetical protein
MFRPTMLASLIAEVLIGKARNILDAKVVLSRHPSSQLVLLRIDGSIMDGDEAKFWRENAELALMISQGLRSQCFLYYVAETPEARQGFVVAQGGQALAGDDATADNLPADTPAGEWPVARLCGQIGITVAELGDAFAGGPRIEIALAEPTGDDRELLTELIGVSEEELAAAEAQAQAGDGAAEPDPEPEPSQVTAAPTQAAADPGSPTPAQPKQPKKPTAAEDTKRRAAEHQAEEEERAAMAAGVRSDLRMVVDDLGVVVAPKAELDDSDLLEPFVVSRIEGDLPDGLPRERTTELQGKRIDIAVAVEFLSEVLFHGSPLTKSAFEEHATTRTLSGEDLQVLEVLGPRLGLGTLVRRGRAGVYLSRTPDMPLPDTLIRALLDDVS